MTSLTKWLVAPATAIAVVLSTTSAIISKRPEGSPVSDSLYANAPAVRLDGAAQKVGNGTTRTYMIVDRQSGAPLEVGVALSEGAMEGLPAPKTMLHGAAGGAMEMDMHTWILDLPARNPTPYKFVTFGFNPQGHEPPGVWDVPHFDFHFYTVPLAVRDSIDPSGAWFAEKAERYPAEAQRAQFYLDAATAARAPRAQMTIPQMGMHWVDVRTPEIQAMAGHPESYKPFTKTYLYGSWDGQFVFGEPMITRAHLLEVKARGGDEVIPVPPVTFAEPGWYPSAYRIRYDSSAREYRIALTQFARTK